MSVEAVDLVVEGRERLLLDGLHGDLVRVGAQLREGRPALAAFLQHVQSDSGKRERSSATSNFVLMAAIMVPARADGDAGLTIHGASVRK